MKILKIQKFSHKILVDQVIWLKLLTSTIPCFLIHQSPDRKFLPKMKMTNKHF